MRFYQPSWGWFFQLSFQEDKAGFAVFKRSTIKTARLVNLISIPKEEVQFEELPPEIQTIITASISCMVETAYTDIKELINKGQK